MKDKAIKKLTEEALENGSQVYRSIEEHLTSICTNDEVAKKILAEEKTIKGAYEAMKKRAMEMAAGATEVCISDEEGFAIVDEYFEINEEDVKGNKVIDVVDLI